MLTENRAQIIVRAIREGNRQPVAARLAGVAPDTLAEWLARGRGIDKRAATPAFKALAEAVDQATAQAEAHALAKVRSNFGSDPASARWFLENSDPHWRQYRAPLVEEPLSAGPAITQNMIVIDRATLEEIALRQIRAAREMDGTGPRAATAADISALVTTERG